MDRVLAILATIPVGGLIAFQPVVNTATAGAPAPGRGAGAWRPRVA